MNTVDWESEHERFVSVAYDRTQRAAKRAYWGWRSNKRDDAIQECLSKMWDSWSRLLQRGKNPELMIGCLIKFAILWVRYDRRIGGRSRMPDVYDYRSHMKKQMLSEKGEASPTDRADASNPWIDWNVQTGDDPAELAAALEKTGISLSQWCDLGD
jgi:hypothetical protein